MLFTDVSSDRAVRVFQKAGFWISIFHAKFQDVSEFSDEEKLDKNRDMHIFRG